MAMSDAEKAAAADRRKQAEIEKWKGHSSAPRPGQHLIRNGTTSESPNPPPADQHLANGLELSEIMMRKTDTLQPDPENMEFEAMKAKQPGYWENLKRDIESAGILSPLLVSENGHVIAGHSRLKIAIELGIQRVPVRLVLSNISQAEIRRRRRLDNLLRFEIDDATRIAMYAEIWPEFFTKPGGSGGRPKKPDNGYPVSESPDQNGKPDNGYPVLPTATEIAQKVGKSAAQVKKDRATAIKATARAQSEGKPIPEASHVTAIKEEENAERRTAARKSSETAKTAGSVLTELAADISQKTVHTAEPSLLLYELAGVVRAAEALFSAGIVSKKEMDAVKKVEAQAGK